MSDRAPPIITPVFRASYCNLVTPRQVADDSDEKKYSMVIVLKKDDPDAQKFIKRLRKAIDAACIEKFGRTVPHEKLKHFPLKDADEDTDQEGDILATKHPEWEGCWTLNASNKRKPGALDKAGNKLFDEEALYSGAWYRASVNVYAWEGKRFGRGISVSLNNVLKERDDEQFSGGSRAEDDFSELIDEDASTDDDQEEDERPKKTKKKSKDPLLG